ncbi:MAG: sigma-70 family RNA polymerase sigma factor [Chloroflexi bacterium]|jgi:RNA polymerase sigma-70 factor (ECF subfamily)|nr:sigma-70 family RNA polymerase sigma factor [Chloroflexota bacterium]
MTGTARREAVEQAYRDHADDVYRVAYALLRDPEAAVDATHDAFARAYERWEAYDARRPLRPWLMTIAANVARDALRRRRVRTLAIPAIAAQARATDAASGHAADPAEIASRRALVEAALDGLEPRARAALVLRHYHGYDHAEIATILGTAPGTVGSLLSRAHATLRARLDDGSGAGAAGPRVGGAADREVLP